MGLCADCGYCQHGEMWVMVLTRFCQDKGLGFGLLLITFRKTEVSVITTQDLRKVAEFDSYLPQVPNWA